MQTKFISPAFFQIFIVFFLIVFPLNSYAENPFSNLKDKIQEEFNRVADQVKEEVKRPFKQPENSPINNEFKSVVPLLIGKTPAEAEIILPQYSLVLGKVVDKKSEQPIGTIISQSHQADSEVELHTAISIEVAIATTPNKSIRVNVPNVIGLKVSEAKTRLQQVGLNLSKIEEKESDLNIGSIVQQSPKSSAKVKLRSGVNIVIAVAKKGGAEYEISLMLAKDKVNVGDEVVMRAIVEPKPQEPVEYSFTIDGKVYSSSSNALSHRFTQNGRVIVTANIRKKRGKWSHSQSRWLVVTKENVVDDSTVAPVSDGVLVPDIIGVSLNEAKVILKGVNLALGNVSQKASSGKSRVIEQNPLSSQRVSKGSKVDIVQSTEYDVSFSLSADKTEIKQHESIEFEGLLRPENMEANINYRLIVDNQQIDSSVPRWKYSFIDAGNYKVIAEVELDGIGLYRSSPVAVHVSSTWQEPVALIEPQSLVIVQGDTADFISQSTHDEKTQLQRFWMDENGGSAKTKGYSIDTKEWDVGEYWVSLRVKDEQGFENTDKIQLIIMADRGEVIEPLEPIDTPEILPEDIKLSLSASSYHVIAGKSLKFTVTQYPLTDTEYHIVFGDDDMKDTSQPWLEHSYRQFGHYSAFVEVNYQQKILRSEPIKIWVWPSWLVLVFMGVGLLLLASLFKFFKPKIKERKATKTTYVNYTPMLDAGEQSLDFEKGGELKNTDISFVINVDEGKQRMLYKQDNKDEQE